MTAVNGVILLIAALHVYFLILEMFFWTKPLGLKAFALKKDFAEASKALAANQGLYNGFLAAGLFCGVFCPQADIGHAFKFFFLTCVAIAGIYGALTVSKKIFFVQALPAIIALAVLSFI